MCPSLVVEVFAQDAYSYYPYNPRGSKGPLRFQKAPSGQNPDRFSKAQKAPSDFFFAFFH